MRIRFLFRSGLLVLLTAAVGACADSETGTQAAVEGAVTETAENIESGQAPTSIPAPADVAAIPENAEVTASGLASRVLVAGSGTVHPGPESRVEVHYSGWTTDGNLFDSSRLRGETAVFPLNRVIAGWTEGLQLMVVGEQRRFWIPAELAYANSSRPGAPRGMLVFDVELVAIRD